MWELKIRKVENGFILETPGEEEVEIGGVTQMQETKTEEVVEEITNQEYEDRYDTNDDEKITMGRLLEAVAEHFGMMNDRYSKENLRISFDGKGSKVDD